MHVASQNEPLLSDEIQSSRYRTKLGLPPTDRQTLKMSKHHKRTTIQCAANVSGDEREDVEKSVFSLDKPCLVIP